MKPWISFVTLILLLGAGSPARADRVSDLVKQVQTNPEVKVRLTAVLMLSKYADPRAIETLIATVGKASEDARVRGFAAMALGRMKIMDAASALQTAARSSDPFLKEKATAALESLCPSNLTGKRLYINMDKAKASGPLAAVAKGIAVIHLAKMLSTRRDVVTGWPKCQKPTESAIKGKGMTGFYMDTNVKVSKEGGKVKCKIDILFTTYPSMSIKGSANATAAAEGDMDADTLGSLIEALMGSLKDDVDRFLSSNQN